MKPIQTTKVTSTTAMLKLLCTVPTTKVQPLQCDLYKPHKYPYIAVQPDCRSMWRIQQPNRPTAIVLISVSAPSYSVVSIRNQMRYIDPILGLIHKILRVGIDRLGQLLSFRMLVVIEWQS
jgi:hypothetical protein